MWGHLVEKLKVHKLIKSHHGYKLCKELEKLAEKANQEVQQ